MKATIAVVTLALVSVLHAADAPELDQLRTNYRAAIERANRPIMQAYLTQLERQRDAYSRAIKLDAANATQTEINQIKEVLAKLDAAKAALPKSTHPPAALNSKEQLFVNTTWRTPADSKFTFLPDGKGFRSFGGADRTSIVWDSRGGGIVEGTGDEHIGGKKTTWFFRFTDTGDGFYGGARNDIDRKLTKEATTDITK